MSMTVDLDVHWSQPFSQAAWNILRAASGQQDSASSPDNPRRVGIREDVIAIGPVLSAATDDSRVAYTQASHSEEFGLHLHLQLFPRPETEPPDAVKAIDTALGGRDGLTRLMLDILPKDEPVVGTYTIRIDYTEANWECRALALAHPEPCAEAITLPVLRMVAPSPRLPVSIP